MCDSKGASPILAAGGRRFPAFPFMPLGLRHRGHFVLGAAGYGGYRLVGLCRGLVGDLLHRRGVLVIYRLPAGKLPLPTHAYGDRRDDKLRSFAAQALVVS